MNCQDANIAKIKKKVLKMIYDICEDKNIIFIQLSKQK